MHRLRVLLLLPVIAVLMAAMTGTASAHAVLESSSPADGSRLEQSPSEVTLHFDEAVAPIAHDTRVLDESQKTVSTNVSSNESSTVTIGLRPSLPVGTYIVQFRVLSADSHPVSGTITFGVGVTPGANAAASAPPPTAPHAVSLLLDVLRILGWIALVLLAGLPAICLLIWPIGLRMRPVQRLVWTGWVLSYVALLGTVLVRGPYDAAEGLGRALNGGLLHATLSSRLGGLLEAQAVLLTVALPVLWALMPSTATDQRAQRDRPDDARPPMVWWLAGAVLAVLLWGTNAAAGHAGAGYLWPLWTGITAVHLAATATWLAGLTALAVVLLRPSPPRAARDRTLMRWSAVATVAVVLLMGTGVAQSLRSINDLRELTATHYGKLLLIKLGLVAGMLLLGLAGRKWVRRSDRDPSVLRRSVTGELALGLAVLVVTSSLSTTAPARDTYSPALHRVTRAAEVIVRVDIPHTRRGQQQITLHFSDVHGRPYRPVKVSSSYYEDNKNLGPLPVVYRQAGSIATGSAIILVPGTWRLRIIVQTSDVDAGIADVLYRVR
jgi:copper transport protein